MKKKFSRIFGLTLALVLALSLVFPAAAVAGENKWTAQVIMTYSTDVFTKTISPSDIPALAGDSDGDALYAVVAADNAIVGYVFKSVDGGATWTKLDHATAPTTAEVLAVAPDDPDYVIAADNTAKKIYISSTGGATWSSSDMTAAFTNGGYGAMTCVDISVPDSSGVRWVAVGGNTATPTAVIQLAKVATFATAIDGILGAVGNDTGFQTTQTYVRAVKFSPMLDYDDTLLVVSANATATDTYFQAANLIKIADALSNQSWNASTDFGTGWPFTLTAAAAVASASMALPDTYDGVEPTARVVYIATPNNVFRTDNTTITIVRTGDFPALAYNSADNMLLIGAGASTSVKMTANPDTATPTFTTPLRYKYPSGDHVAAVAWVGSTMVCATTKTGNADVDESALSVSTDARSWNQVSLIDTDLADMTDVAVSADGATKYLASVQQNNASIWRYASGWERVFCDDIDSDVSAGDVLVRFVPGDPDHVLIGEVGGDEIRVSTNAGETWKRSKAKITIVDIVVEDADSVYVLGTTKVSKSTDGGFHFATGKLTKLVANSHMVVANGDVLVAGTYAGVVTVAYSDDGAATFSRTVESTAIIPESDKPILIAADKDYATNSAIFVACNEDSGSDNKIMRWEIGAGAEEWKSQGPADTVLADAYWFTGLGYYGGALYATATNDDLSTHVFSLDPGTAAPLHPTWGTPAAAFVPTAEFGCAPQALKISSESNRLWAVDIDASPNKLWSFADTISVDVVAPTLLSPDKEFVGSIDVVLERIDPIRFSWESVHTQVFYQLDIATNEAITLNVESYDVLLKHEYITISDGVSGDAYPFIAGETYYWRVKVSSPISGAWSEVRSFTVEESVEAPVEVTVEVPPVEVTVEAPAVTVEAPIVTVPAPVITVEAPAAADITVEIPPAEAPETPGYIWSIIAIGAVLVIAVIILIIRTRRVV